MAAHTNNSKPFLSNQEAPTSVLGLGLTLSNEEAKASGPFQWLLYDTNDDINIKGYGDHMSVKLQILCLSKQPSTNTNTTKHRHEVLRSLIYKFKNRKDMWHWFFHGFLACYTDGKMVTNDVYVNEINGWVSMYEVGKLMMVLNAEKVFDEIAKRQSEDVAGNLFDRMTPLFHNNVVCFQFFITRGEFWNAWDPGGRLVKILYFVPSTRRTVVTSTLKFLSHNLTSSIMQCIFLVYYKCCNMRKLLLSVKLFLIIQVVASPLSVHF